MTTRYMGNPGAIADYVTRQEMVRLDEGLSDVADTVGRFIQNNQVQEIDSPGEDSTSLKIAKHLRLRDDKFLYWAPKLVDGVANRSAGIRWHVSGVSPDRFEWDVKKSTKMTLDADGRLHLGLTNDPAIFNTSATTAGVLAVYKSTSAADGLILLSNNVSTTAGAVVTFQTANDVAFCQFRGVGNANEYSYIALGDRQGFTGTGGHEWYMVHTKRATPGNDSLEWEYWDGTSLYAPMAINTLGRLHLGGLTLAGSAGNLTGALLNLDLDTANLTTTSGIILRRDGSQSADLLQFQLQTGAVSTVCDASFRWHMGGTSAALTDRLKVTGNVNEGGINIANVTQTTAAGYGLNVTQTWNGAGANFTAADINVTPTAFFAASLSYLFRVRSSSSVIFGLHPINNQSFAAEIIHPTTSTVATTPEHKYGLSISAGSSTATSWACTGLGEANVEPLFLAPLINNTNSGASFWPFVNGCRIDMGQTKGYTSLFNGLTVVNFAQSGDWTVQPGTGNTSILSAGISVDFNTPSYLFTAPAFSAVFGRVTWGDISFSGGGVIADTIAAVEATTDIDAHDGTIGDSYGLLVRDGRGVGATRHRPGAIGGTSDEGGWIQLRTKNYADADDADNGIVWSSAISGSASAYGSRLARVGYNPTDTKLEFEIGTTVELVLSSSALSPFANAGLALGANGLGWGSLWLKDTAAAFELQVQATGTGFGADRVLTIDVGNANRTLNLIPSAAYTITNGTTDRTFDANATTIDELADLIYTMWFDLNAKGILG